MTATGGFAIAAGHHRAPAGSSCNSRARPLGSPLGRPSLFGAGLPPRSLWRLRYSSRGRARRLPTVQGERQPSKPISEIRIGSVKAAIWPNDAEGRTRYTVTFSRLYKDGDQWKTTQRIDSLKTLPNRGLLPH